MPEKCSAVPLHQGGKRDTQIAPHPQPTAVFLGPISELHSSGDHPKQRGLQQEAGNQTKIGIPFSPTLGVEAL